MFKVDSACAKCFAVRILKFEILQITWKKWNKEHQTLSFQFFTNIFSILMFLVLFFHVVFRISNFDKWTAKHFAKASCTELTLLFGYIISVLASVKWGSRRKTILLLLLFSASWEMRVAHCTKYAVSFWILRVLISIGF